MRKALAVLIMISVCSIYFIAMKNKGVEQVSTEETTFLKANVEMDKRIQEITKEIEKEYPKTPKLLIETANEIMKLQYSKEWEPESKIESQTLLALRLLYSEELLALNSYEKQLEALEMELSQNHKKDLYLKEARIDSIKFETADHALVSVLNETNKGMQQREYTLIKEEGLWKIYSWIDLNQ
nr:DUF6715 family protein [uncultured Niameybacter sp.]